MVKILIAYDGSESSNDALAELRHAGLPQDVEATVLTVSEAWMPALLDPALNVGYYSTLFRNEIETVRATLGQARSDAEKAAAKIRAEFPSWNVKAEAVSETAAEGILTVIDSWKPDLVVMGSHGWTPVGEVLFGSVTHKILTHSHCNLRVSRSAHEARDPRTPVRVLVAFDGSADSETAFQAALSRTWPQGSAIRLLTVIDDRVASAFVCPPAPIRYWMRPEDGDAVAWVDRMLEDQKRRIEEKGYRGQADSVRGQAKRVLLQEAKAWDADVVFAGPRGLSARQRILLGSVSAALAMRAPCSVEVVHRAWGTQACCAHAHDGKRECLAQTEVRG